MRRTISDDVYMVSPIVDYYGSEPKFSISVPDTDQGAATIANDATLEMIVYTKGKDVSASRTTGSITAYNAAGADPVVETKTFENLVGGETLFVLIRGTVDGILRTIVIFEFHVQKEGGSSRPLKNDHFLISPRLEYYGAEPAYSFSVPGVNIVTDDSTLDIDSLVGGEELFVLIRGTCDGVLRTIVAFWHFVKKESGR